LIPVTFVEIRDPVTGLRLDSFPTNIPQVEEWKKATAEYKAAAIPLGRLDLPPDQRVTNSPFQAQANSQGGGSAVPSNRASQRTQASQRTRSSAGSATGLGAGAAAAGMPRHHQEPPRTEPHPSAAQAAETEPMLPPGELTELGVPSFHNESGNYWFRLHAVHVPDDDSAPASKLILYRTYEDFYDFQIALLDTFPAEAGRPENEGEAPPPRILPYMPGPVDEAIDDELTEYRRDELDAYVRALLDLRGADAGYILRHELIRSFFAAKFGDYSEEITREQGMENLQNLAHRMSAMNLGGGQQPHHANNRSVDQAAMPPPPAPQQSPVAAYNNGHAYAGHGHTRSASRDLASSQGHGRQISGQQGVQHAGQWTNSPSTATGPTFANHHTVPTPPMPSAPAAAPPPNPRSGAAFVKIKVYDKATDDLIALRLHPNVTYAELLEKVRARLGPDVNVLSYKVGGTGGSAAAGAHGPTQAIRDDRDMAEWMAAEDQRLILYAEQ
jgi:bud emergence protein 1